MQLIPAMDIIDGEVVRLAQGNYDRKKVYSTDPIKTAREFAKAGVSRLHLVDLTGAKAGQVAHQELFGAIKKETGCVIEAGGGIRSRKEIEMLCRAGMDPETDFFMLGSLPFKNEKEFQAIAEEYGSQILLTVDVWARSVRIAGWQEEAGEEVLPFLGRMQSAGVKNFLVTQIQRDGMLSGPDRELYREICQEYGDISVIVSGGVASMDDLKDLPAGVAGVIIGRAFYENRITLNDIRSYVK